MFELQDLQKPLGSRQEQLMKTTAYQAGPSAYEPLTIQMITG